MSDRVLGTFGVLLAAFYIWSATTIRESFVQDAIGPKTFPIIVGIVLAAASAYFILRPDPEPKWPGARALFDVALAVAVMFAYAQLLPELGFLIATFFATIYLSFRLGSPPLEAVAIAVGTSIGLYFIFATVLGLSLARGPMGF